VACTVTRSSSVQKRFAFGTLGIALLLLGAIAIHVALRSPVLCSHCSHLVAPEIQDDWHAFGGTWQLANGVIRNNSDDRGAKFISGAPSLQNYMIQADIQLLGEYGFAGLIIRSSDAEEGVDSYRGYTADLSDLDNALFLGHADFGWQNYAEKMISPRIYDQEWYHLKLLAYDCIIAVSSTAPNGQTASLAVQVPHCIRSGQFGLRSYNTGAEWKNINVRLATHDDLIAMIGNTPPALAVPSQHPLGYDAATNGRFLEPLHRALLEHRSDPDAQSISTLRLLSPIYSQPVTVHGVVTLTNPGLFIQDSTGGAVIHQASTEVPLQIGDEVEAHGYAHQNDFSSVLLHASVRKLWTHTSIQPVVVTASEAATGLFDADSIDIQGVLLRESEDSGGRLTLTLEDGSQSFLAILAERGDASSFHHLKALSRLRLRGICVVDPIYTNNTTPFAILLPSFNDVQVVAGPPWWNAGHIILLMIGVILVFATGLTLFLLIQRKLWQAVVEEREHLALELHDTLAQSFAGIGFQLEAIQDEVSDYPCIGSLVDTARAMVKTSHEEARRSIASLHPENTGSVGLLQALENSAHRMTRNGSAIVVRTVAIGEEFPLSLRICDNLFRIGQEGIANAITHGRPGSITLSLSYLKSSLELVITDDGSGFVESSESAGFGIRGMIRRAEAISAHLTIQSTLGKGTEVHVVCPRGSSGWMARLGWIRRALLGTTEFNERANV
jgi:signal transduction histidine kinase